MKKLLLGLVILLSFSAIAGEFDRISQAQIMGLPQQTLEKKFLNEFCPDSRCEFGYGVRNSYKLSKAQKLAIFNYTLGYFESLNPALYSGKINNEQVAFSRVLDLALSKLPSQKVKVYRGTSKRFLAAVGNVVEFKAYSSSSLDRGVAESFIVDRLLILKLKSGKDIQQYSNAGGEREILIPRGVKFRVENVSIKKIVFEGEEGLKSVKVEVVEMVEI